MRKEARLVLEGRTEEDQSFPFLVQAVIGRRQGRDTPRTRRVVLSGDAISGRHCVIRQETDGRFYIRDESRNGTRLDGRRLVPSVLVPIEPGQAIELPDGHRLRLEVGAAATSFGNLTVDSVASTASLPDPLHQATILVGDIAGYTAMNQAHRAQLVASSVTRVFGELSRVIAAHQGMVCEYEGDALLAVWEATDEPGQASWHAAAACNAALACSEVATALGRDPRLWPIASHDLRVDWALTTGYVVIANSKRAGARGGLALYGWPVMKAYALEKCADANSGRIVIDSDTYKLVSNDFALRPLGKRSIDPKGGQEPVWSLGAPTSRRSARRRPESMVSKA